MYSGFERQPFFFSPGNEFHRNGTALGFWCVKQVPDCAITTLLLGERQLPLRPFLKHRVWELGLSIGTIIEQQSQILPLAEAATVPLHSKKHVL